MTTLICYLENEKKGGWANIRMASGDHCWVEVKKMGIVVKRSKSGLFGVKLYEQKDGQKALASAGELGNKYPNVTPDEMRDPLLKPIVNAILHCNNLAEVTRILNKA